MHNKNLFARALLSLAFFTFTAHAASAINTHPFYVGISSGYGSTTWDGLVPDPDHQNLAMSMSTPIEVTEGGLSWSTFVGYEIIPFFAIEGAYARYPNANITFDPISVITWENDGLTQLISRTETYSVMGKIMLQIPHTQVRAYSSAGVADVHRWDELENNWRLSPTFAIGINYNLNDHVMAEIGANYTGGYGEAELDPSEDFVPFLYSLFVRVAYRF